MEKNLKERLSIIISKFDIVLKNENSRRILLLIMIIVLIIINIFKRAFGMDFIILTLLIMSLCIGESWKFVKDWMPPMALFYLYEALRAWAVNIHDKFNISPIVEPLIKWERALFFFLDDIPSVELQYALRKDFWIASWYDYVLFFFYSTFFWYWLAVGFIVWVKKRELFKPYAYGLAIFSIVDVFIYAIFPSAPPWWASDNGYLVEIRRILWHNNYLPSDGLSMVSTYGRNDFAAFPSHHTAWPFYASLFLINLYGKKAIPSLLIPLLIAFATWYGAEHYVIDSLAGIFVAGVTYIVAVNWKKIVRKVRKIMRKNKQEEDKTK